MAIPEVDWTVDKLLAFMRDVNLKAAQQAEATRINRAQFRAIQARVAKITDPAKQAKLKAALTAWIHRQVEIENRVRDFTAKWTSAKNAVRGFLQSSGVTPPTYLSGLGFAVAGVPVAIIVLAVAAGAALTMWLNSNKAQAQGLSAMDDVIGMVAAGTISADKGVEMLKQLKDAAEAKDPLGLSRAMEKAVPIGLIVLAVLLLPRISRQRMAA